MLKTFAFSAATIMAAQTAFAQECRMAAIGAGCDTPPRSTLPDRIEPVRSLEYGAG